MPSPGPANTRDSIAADPANELSTQDALHILERFVIDNDDLVELEAAIGRFNIFDALGIVRNEIRHSNFLAWLLDPAGSHGTGQVFLSAVLMDMLHSADPATRPLSPVELDGRDLGGVDIRRESDSIDILIAIADPAIVIAIENKIDSGEHSNQLSRYREIVARRFPTHNPLFVFLTREGDEPSDEAWTSYSYADLHRTLSRVRRLNASAIGEDVLAFLNHYLSMIGSRFMDDPKIDELCDRIYRNHRQALDLIFGRRADPRRLIIDAFAEGIASADYPGETSDRTSTSFQFTPHEWIEILPPINRRPQGHANAWVTMSFRPGPNLKKASVNVVVGPTTDPKQRLLLLEAIRKDVTQKRGSRYGFVLNRGEFTDRYTRVFQKTIYSNRQSIEIDEALLARVRAAGVSMTETMQSMAGLLKRVFTDAED